MISLIINELKKTIMSVTKKIFSFIKEWSQAINAIAMVFSLVYVVYSTRENLLLLSQTISLSNDQLSLQLKSIPAQFEIDYENVNQYSEQAFITNSGKTKLINLIAEYEYYFINIDSLLLSSTNIVNYVSNNKNILELLRKYNLIKSPFDFNGLLGTSRKFNIAYLEPNQKTLLDISSSSIQNAIRLNRLLGTQLFMRWKIQYNTELSNKKILSQEYIWLNDYSLNLNNMLSYSQRANLRHIPGGQRIIKQIENYEAETIDIIFK